MPKLPRWTAIEAERALLDVGFELLRSKESHRNYGVRSPGL
jgi:predicted RNA binding protein YcfA (HicA-like mRNA interferase family)